MGFTHLGNPCGATVGTVTYYCLNNPAGIPQGRLGVAAKQPLPPSRSPTPVPGMEIINTDDTDTEMSHVDLAHSHDI